jgi:transcriptional regulator with XRE-family HTH domain
LTRAKVNKTDRSVGERLRARRRELDLSQTDVARHVGLTSQQILKYEKGIDRIAAGRLLDIARVLRVPIRYFFQDMEAQHTGLPSPGDREQEELRAFASTKEARELGEAFCRMRNVEQRRQVIRLVQSLAADSTPDGAMLRLPAGTGRERK